MDFVPRNYEVDGHKLTVPLSDEVNIAYNRWLESHRDEIVALLAPFGVHPFEMPMAELHRYVMLRDAEDLNEQFEWERKSLAREQKESSDG